MAAEPADSLEVQKLSSLKAAVLDLKETFRTRYPNGAEYLAKIGNLEQRLQAIESANPPDKTTREIIRAEILQSRREMLSANPLITEFPLIFTVRPQYHWSHHNTHTFFPTYDGEFDNPYTPGGALKKVDFSKGLPGKVTTLINLPEGKVRDPDVYFDGRKILFSMRLNRQDDYSLYEIRADGGGLTTLTFASGVDDLFPIYLPDDSIVFVSTREPKYVMCNRQIMANLFRMEKDGANIHQISKNTLFDDHPALMPDGRIIYSRWEYVDRNFGDAQGLWTSMPDGRIHALYFGNNTPSPGGILNPRPIWGTDLVACIFSSCHDRPWGAFVILDRRYGMELPVEKGPSPVRHILPASAIGLCGGPDGTTALPKPNGYGFDNFIPVTPKYEDPWPLFDPTVPASTGKYFLVSRMTGEGEAMGLYLLDCRRRIPLAGNGPRAVTVFGNRFYGASFFTDTVNSIEGFPGGKLGKTYFPLQDGLLLYGADLGEKYFHDADFCYQKWQSCASCHPDGRADGLNWDLLNDGIGNPKDTKSLLFSHVTPPAMITGVRDKAETAVRAGFKYIQFQQVPESVPAAVDLYLQSLRPVPSPYLVNGQLSEAAVRGRKLYRTSGCLDCHSGPYTTDQKAYDLKHTTGKDRGKKLDTPGLAEIWRTAPYLYDGRAADMGAVLTEHNPGDHHGETSTLTPEEIQDLIEYLLSIGRNGNR